jgi:hypothetical protein
MIPAFHVQLTNRRERREWWVGRERWVLHLIHEFMTYKDNEGYKKLIVWQNCKLLRKMIYEITQKFPKSEYRRVSQMNDAARSTKQN